MDALSGDAVWFGHVTRTGMRTLHLAAREGSDAPRIVEAWAARHRALRLSVHFERDVRWQFAREWS